MKKTIVITLCIFITIAGLGCAALSRYATPAEIDKEAVNYAVDAGVADPTDFNGWPNLVKAEKLQTDVDAAHNVIQLNLQQLLQKDNLTYSIHSGVVASNLQVAQAREEALFGEKGLLSLGLSMAGFGTLTGLLGLMRKRPTDWTPEEVDAALTKANIDAGMTGQSITEIVKGIDDFMKSNKDKPDIIEALKLALSKQSIETRETVAKIKAVL